MDCIFTDTELKNVKAFLHSIKHNRSEVAACVAAYPDFVPLIHSVLPRSVPALPGLAQLLEAASTTDQAISIRRNDEAFNSPAKRKRPSKPSDLYERAVASARKIHAELGSVAVLSELQRDLQRERARTQHNAQQRQNAKPALRYPGEERMGKHPENLEVNHHNLQSSPRLEVAIKRYRRTVIARQYHAALHNRRDGAESITEEFALKYLPDGATSGLSKKELRAKWKTIIHQYRFWEQLSNSCGGGGVLLLLPADFHDE